MNERSERDLRLQISEERREAEAANAKRDERMSVLEAKFEALRSTNRVVVGIFSTLCITVVGAAATIILTGGPH